MLSKLKLSNWPSHLPLDVAFLFGLVVGSFGPSYDWAFFLLGILVWAFIICLVEALNHFNKGSKP